MLRRFFLIGVVMALAAGCGSSPTSPTTSPPPSDDPPSAPPAPPAPVYTLGVTKILAFGDSMTYGVVPAAGLRFTLDAGIPQSYPFKLQALIASRYTSQSIAVYNCGIGGKKAAEDRDRLEDCVKESSSQLVLLMEGANDLNNIAISGLSGTNQLVDSVVGAMEDMVRDLVERRGIPVFLATLPPMRDPKGWGKALVPRYNDGLRAMAAKKGATLVDIGAQIPDSMIGSDGLHPTEEGYQRIAEIFFDAIKQKFETTAVTTSVR